MQPAATILIVKSGISNHAASGILDFTPKNSPLPVTLERYGSLIFVYSLSPVRFPGCRGLSNTALPF